MVIGHDGSKSSGESTPFRLLELPPELWSRIVRSSITANQTLIPWHWLREEVMMRMKQPAIARTSRIVREETLSTFYTKSYGWYVNRNNASLFIDWLRAIPEQHRTSLDIIITLLYRSMHQDLGIALISIGYALEDYDAWKDDVLVRKCRVVALSQLGMVR
ncbi:hypothetical protein LTR56_018162 [Elasticomyces elasticus]|nr:hypothetical protein LTR22_024845 [Elasticomyces elasticus]KAK3629275.1 hypothetical protein LTR56_018162 [Elasticomyces elasticus]KAK4912812.1 hypothetical protein LTR49_018774 [Elasticomyces elasticus]KAK5742557.1 hypothetical protein LTS12_024188 [Elasticomyces elasticus]